MKVVIDGKSLSALNSEWAEKREEEDELLPSSLLVEDPGFIDHHERGLTDTGEQGRPF